MTTRNQIIFLVLSLLAAPFSWAATQSTKCGSLSFERNSTISMQDFARLADHKIISGDAGSIAIFDFDDEDRPHKKGVHAVGIVFARIGDLGEMPVGGYIWSPDTFGSVLFEQVKPAGDDVVVQALPKSLDEKCALKPLTMTLKSNGQLLIDGQVVGAVK